MKRETLKNLLNLLLNKYMYENYSIQIPTYDLTYNSPHILSYHILLVIIQKTIKKNSF